MIDLGVYRFKQIAYPVATMAMPSRAGFAKTKFNLNLSVGLGCCRFFLVAYCPLDSYDNCKRGSLGTRREKSWKSAGVVEVLRSPPVA